MKRCRDDNRAMPAAQLTRVPAVAELAALEPVRIAELPPAQVLAGDTLKPHNDELKRRGTRALHCPSAPTGVIDGSRANMSLHLSRRG
jgi:hypothetical protein